MYYISRDINKAPLKPLTCSMAVINLPQVLMLPSPFQTLSCLLRLRISQGRLSLTIFFGEMTGTMRCCAHFQGNSHVKVQSLFKMKSPRTYSLMLAGGVFLCISQVQERNTYMDFPPSLTVSFLTGSLTNESHSRCRFMHKLLIKYHLNQQSNVVWFVPVIKVRSSNSLLLSGS